MADRPSANGTVTMDSSVDPVAGGGGGTTDHRDLSHRDAANSHPVDAITGLAERLVPEIGEEDEGRILAVVEGEAAFAAVSDLVDQISEVDYIAVDRAEDTFTVLKVDGTTQTGVVPGDLGDGMLIMFADSSPVSFVRTQSGSLVDDSGEHVDGVYGATGTTVSGARGVTFAVLGGHAYRLAGAVIAGIVSFLDEIPADGSRVTLDDFTTPITELHVGSGVLAPTLVGPDPAANAGKIFHASSVDANGPGISFVWEVAVDAMPASLGVSDGLIGGAPDTDYSGGNSVTLHFLRDGAPVDIVLNTDLVDTEGLIAAISTPLNATFDGDTFAFVTNDTGAAVSLEFLSEDADGASTTTFQAAGPKTGSDAGTVDTGIWTGIANYSGNDGGAGTLLTEPDPALSAMQQFAVISDGVNWLPYRYEVFKGTTEEITHHDGESGVDPADGPDGNHDIRNLAYGSIRSAAGVARAAAGRNVVCDDVDQTVVEQTLNRGAWVVDNAAIYTVQVFNPRALLQSVDMPRLCGPQTIEFKNFTAPHTAQLPKPTLPGGGPLIYVTDGSVDETNTVTVAAPDGEAITRADGSTAATLVLDTPQTMTVIVRLDGSWRVWTATSAGTRIIAKGYAGNSSDIASTLGGQDDGTYLWVVNGGDTSQTKLYDVESGDVTASADQPAAGQQVLVLSFEDSVYGTSVQPVLFLKVGSVYAGVNWPGRFGVADQLVTTATYTVQPNIDVVTCDTDTAAGTVTLDFSELRDRQSVVIDNIGTTDDVILDATISGIASPHVPPLESRTVYAGAEGLRFH